MWKALSLLAANEAGTAMKRNVTILALYLAAGGVALIAAIFGLIAAQNWLALHMSDIQAGLIIAGGLLVVAMLLLIAAMIIRRRKHRSAALATAAFMAVPLAGRMIGGRINIGTLAILTAGAVGLLFGRSLSGDDK